MAGANFWRLHNNAAVTATWGFYFSTAATAFGGFKAGVKYVVSFYARCTAPSGNSFLATWNNGPQVSYWLANPTLINGTWQRYVLVVEWTSNPIDVNGVFFYLSTQSLPINTDTDIACVQVEVGDTPSGWSPPPVSSGNPITATNQSTFIQSLNADAITAGSIRGINVNSSSHTTKGTYLTAGTSGGESTISIKDGTDFHASGGTAVFVDSSNDMDSFTYTGKTATSLTGCSGVLAHNNGAVVVPLINNGTYVASSMIAATTNDLRVFDDRGDGTFECIAAIGPSAVYSNVAAVFGSLNSGASNVGVYGRSYGNSGVFGTSNDVSAIYGVSVNSNGISGQSTYGNGLQGWSSSGGDGLYAYATSGYGAKIQGNSTKSAFCTTPLGARPSSAVAGDFSMLYTTGGGVGTRNATPRLCFYDGTNWCFVHDNSVFNG
jgi:hypothetical protein